MSNTLNVTQKPQGQTFIISKAVTSLLRVEEYKVLVVIVEGGFQKRNTIGKCSLSNIPSVVVTLVLEGE